MSTHEPASPERQAGSPPEGMLAALAAGGEVGRDLLRVDWDATGLGPPDTWPGSLQLMVRMVLACRFSMWMAWGPGLVFFCNEAYRRDTLGTKYPWALGRPAAEVWEEIWPDIGPRIHRVIGTGVATWDEDLLLFLERSGYVEETYHTFSYSPLNGDDGSVQGMLCVVSEETDRVVTENRMSTLRQLGSDAGSLRTEAALLDSVRAHLGDNPKSLPFTLIYLFDGDDGTARLAAASGISPGHLAAPVAIKGADPDPAWPAGRAEAGETAVVDLDPRRFPDLPTGAWRAPPTQALVVPLAQGRERPYGFLVAGLNRYRPFNADYRSFVTLIAGQIAAGIASARAYEAERRRAEQLAELDRAKTAFFTNVSHEFRTPLTLLLGPAEDAVADTEHPLDPVQRDRVEMIHRNGERLLRLVNTLLDFSRLESGRITARYVPTDLARYTAELASMFRSAVERAGLELRISVPPLSEPAYVDLEMWAKIVLNLLSNALKFTFSGSITVGLAETDGHAELTVADTGIGIEPAEQVHLFERFHRVVDARSRTHEGSGIGLALVSELARLHDGWVSVDSTPGEGSTFTVRVPLGSGHLPAEQVRAEEAELAGVPARHAEGFIKEAMRWFDAGTADTGSAAVAGLEEGAELPRVLVVDDTADMRSYIAHLLAPAYRVETAADGAIALERAIADPPDLVLTDVMMPNLDGFGLLAALRNHPATMAIPVVMLSARATEAGVIEGLEAGADDYLAKPFSARELTARVHANLELDRVRRTRDELARSQSLLDQAQGLARIGSWELEVGSGSLTGSAEFCRQVQLSGRELAEGGLDLLLTTRVHPDDAAGVRAALGGATVGEPVEYEFRLIAPDGQVRVYRSIGRLEPGSGDRPARLVGSNQDVTDQRRAEQQLAAAAAEREAAAREHRIADELQRSLLPPRNFDPQSLDVAAYYQAGVEGTQVGGDWYDVIELRAGRTALVIGDVMGRGVRAASVMGQLRSAVRAYSRLELRPSQVLNLCDELVSDLGEDQIVTCVYAVFDPADGSLLYANAGHLPPLLASPGQPTARLRGGSGPPLGAGPLRLEGERVHPPAGAVLALYTDGLVERRDSDIGAGISALAGRLAECRELPVSTASNELIKAMLPSGPDDDVALLLAQITAGERSR